MIGCGWFLPCLSTVDRARGLMRVIQKQYAQQRAHTGAIVTIPSQSTHRELNHYYCNKIWKWGFVALGVYWILPCENMVVYLGFFSTSRALCRYQGGPGRLLRGPGAGAIRPRQFLRKNYEGSVLLSPDAFSWSMLMHGVLSGMSSKVVFTSQKPPGHVPAKLLYRRRRRSRWGDG